MQDLVSRKKFCPERDILAPFPTSRLDPLNKILDSLSVGLKETLRTFTVCKIDNVKIQHKSISLGQRNRKIIKIEQS